MKKEQKEFDERQLQIRNNIFKHGFIIAILALLLNAYLNRVGIVWADAFYQNLLIAIFSTTVVYMECHFHDVFIEKNVPRTPILAVFSVTAIALAILSIIDFVKGAIFIANGMLTTQGATVVLCIMFSLNSSYAIIQHIRNKRVDKLVSNIEKSKNDKNKEGL